MEELATLIEEYCSTACDEVDDRWRAWEIDLSKSEVHEVLGGLLSRQATLAIEIVSNPGIWTPHIAPVLLRAMIDAHITLKWLLLDPESRCQEYIRYGLGQIKLRIEHHKALWVEESPSEPEKRMVESLETWLESQRIGLLTEVNVGSWSQKKVRDMAIEANESNLYNFAYTPFSAAAHSMWHHIEQYNLEHCTNPLHRFHRIPAIIDMGLEPYNAYLAAKYFDKTLVTFDAAFDLGVSPPTSFDLLNSGLRRIFDVTNGENDKTDEV